MTDPFRDQDVCITGKMASMDREEAIQRIASSGGRFVAMPDDRTAVIVVGQYGPPLSHTGAPTAALTRARDLADAGLEIEFLPESEFLVRIGATELVEDFSRLYTAEQVARMLLVPAPQIRAWVRQGLLRPARRMRRLCFFDFQQVRSARALHRLLEQGVPRALIRDGLERVARWSPDASQVLSCMESGASLRELTVRLASGQLAEPSGQLCFDFEAAGEERASGGGEAQEPPIYPHPSARSSIDWFDAGLRAEEDGRHVDAVAAYRRELIESGPSPEVHFNLGNALFALRRRREAAAAFRASVGLDPEYVEAWNNLGNVLADDQRMEEAIRAYQRSLAMEPNYADAHYNLAETLSSLGRVEDAKPHWLRYLALDPRSPWADRARERLGGS